MSEDWSDLTSIGVESADPIDDLTPGSKANCPDCGKLLTVTKAGTIRGHKCVNDVPDDPKSKSALNRNRKKTPAQVRRLSVALIASGIETGAAHMVGRYVPCDPAIVPVDLSDADVMVGPLVDMAWPQLPKRAQSVLKSIADESDLIVAALAWWEWGANLRKWARAQHAEHITAHATEDRGDNVVSIGTQVAGARVAEQFVPFAPA